jgi:tetratricopeptide (TPR) repeat protein
MRACLYLAAILSQPLTVSAWSLPDQSSSQVDLSRLTRRGVGGRLAQLALITTTATGWTPAPALATTEADTVMASAVPTNPDSKKLFQEGRALESQGNLGAAQRIYKKVTNLDPNFVYGWSNLGNTQTALGDLSSADDSYTRAIDLCNENLKIADTSNIAKCKDDYLLYLNRGSLRLNNKATREALDDLSLANQKRGRPDAILLQNLARAEEVNGQYANSAEHYNLAIQMTANEVSPYWLRASLVELQLGRIQNGYDLFQRVNNKFPQVPEVLAALAAFRMAKGDADGAQQAYLQMADKQRLKYVSQDYIQQTIAWPPRAIELLSQVTEAAGDGRPR